MTKKQRNKKHMSISAGRLSGEVRRAFYLQKIDEKQSAILGWSLK